mgnify:FL=1
MRKILFLLIGVLFLFAACDSDTPTPFITRIEYTSSGEENSPFVLFTDGYIDYRVAVDNTDPVTIQWLVNKEVKGEGKEFHFAPGKRGEYEMQLVVYNADKKGTAMALNPIKVVDLLPSIVSFTCDGKPIKSEDELQVTASTSLEFKAKYIKTDKLRHAWLLNGDTLRNTTPDHLLYDKGLSGKLELVLTNQDDMSTRHLVNLAGPYNEGSYIYASNKEGFSFLPNEGDYIPDNLYKQINPQGLGESGVTAFYMGYNQLYLVVPTGLSGKMEVVIADAQTLKEIKRVSSSQFTPERLGEVTRISLAGKEKVLLQHSDRRGNKGGITPFDLVKKEIGKSIVGTTGQLGIDGPGYTPIVKLNRELAVATANKILFLSLPMLLPQEGQTLTIDKERQIVDMVKGSNNTLLVFVNGRVDKSLPNWEEAKVTSGATVLHIDRASLKLIEEVPLRLGGENLFLEGGATHASLVASPTTNEVYFRAKRSSEGKSDPAVFVYNSVVKKTSVLFEYSDLAGSKLPYSFGHWGVTPENQLLLPLTDGERTDVIKYDLTQRTESGGPYSLNGVGSIAVTADY